MSVPALTPEHIRHLADQDPERRAQAAQDFFMDGKGRTLNWFNEWSADGNFYSLVVQEQFVLPDGKKVSFPKLTIGIAVLPETFEKIHAANGSPPLAEVVVEAAEEYSQPGRDYQQFTVLIQGGPAAE